MVDYAADNHASRPEDKDGMDLESNTSRNEATHV
jgi:hypothetical protein